MFLLTTIELVCFLNGRNLCNYNIIFILIFITVYGLSQHAKTLHHLTSHWHHRHKRAQSACSEHRPYQCSIAVVGFYIDSYWQKMLLYDAESHLTSHTGIRLNPVSAEGLICRCMSSSSACNVLGCLQKKNCGIARFFFLKVLSLMFW